ncbi:MAG TPA: RDD family protein [Vicinamibacterales bacterium]|nr:RDD family protein [Vicinamibacterales bacterium]
MKCPKCGYLGFEEVERCRNCGYDFSLAALASIPEMPLRGESPLPNPLDDLTFGDTPPRAPGKTTAELPLFGPSVVDDDQPLITRPSPPRPPLSVRRATPEVPRLRTEPRSQSLDLSLDPEQHTTAPVTPGTRAFQMNATVEPLLEHLDATVGARLFAVVLDLLILAAVDALVVYLTIQICGITFDELAILPKGPLVAFLLLQNCGYLVAFTAGGQTLGKMAAGIRVVSSDEDSALDLGRALLRTLMWIVLAVPAGLGFLTAVLSRDHRGLHDRFAGTRVVR